MVIGSIIIVIFVAVTILNTIAIISPYTDYHEHHHVTISITVHLTLSNIMVKSQRYIKIQSRWWNKIHKTDKNHRGISCQSNMNHYFVIWISLKINSKNISEGLYCSVIQKVRARGYILLYIMLPPRTTKCHYFHYLYIHSHTIKFGYISLKVRQNNYPQVSEIFLNVPEVPAIAVYCIISVLILIPFSLYNSLFHHASLNAPTTAGMTFTFRRPHNRATSLLRSSHFFVFSSSFCFAHISPGIAILMTKPYSSDFSSRTTTSRLCLTM